MTRRRDDDDTHEMGRIIPPYGSHSNPPPARRGCLSAVLIPLLVLAALVAISIAIAAAGGES